MRTTCVRVGLALWASSVVMFSTTIAAEPVKTARVKQREAVEAVLAKPAEWTPNDAETVTLAEFIDHVREKHGLSIRWDVASIQAAGGIFESFAMGGRKSTSEYITQWNPLPTSPQLETYSAVAPARVQQYITNFGPPSINELNGLDPIAPAPVSIPASPAPLPPEATKKRSPAPAVEQDGASVDEDSPHLVLAGKPTNRSAVALTGASVGEMLDQLLEAVQPPISGGGDEIGIPMVTRAFTLTYVVEGHSVVITTQLRANAMKETRVYRISHLKGMPPEQVAKTICHSVRPWSWRTQAGEIADRLAARFPKGNLSLPQVAIASAYSPGPILTASGDVPASLPPGVSTSISPLTVHSNPGASSLSTPPAELKAEDIASLGQLLTGGAIAAVESIVNTVEIVHYGDPPTAVMEVLPGVLVVTQSQAAHREIAELLEELAQATP